MSKLLICFVYIVKINTSLPINGVEFGVYSTLLLSKDVCISPFNTKYSLALDSHTYGK